MRCGAVRGLFSSCRAVLLWLLVSRRDGVRRTRLPTRRCRWVIYNDEKVAESERPPRELGYMYLFRRLGA